MPHFLIREEFYEKTLCARSALIEADTIEDAQIIYQEGDNIDWDDYDTIETIDSFDYELDEIKEVELVIHKTTFGSTYSTYEEVLPCPYCGEVKQDCKCNKEEIKKIEEEKNGWIEENNSL